MNLKVNPESITHFSSHVLSRSFDWKFKSHGRVLGEINMGGHEKQKTLFWSDQQSYYHQSHFYSFMTVTVTFSKQKPPITKIKGKKTQLMRHDTKPCANLRHKKLEQRPIFAPSNLGLPCQNFAAKLLLQPRLTYLNPIRPAEPADRQAP